MNAWTSFVVLELGGSKVCTDSRCSAKMFALEEELKMVALEAFLRGGEYGLGFVRALAIFHKELSSKVNEFSFSIQIEDLNSLISFSTFFLRILYSIKSLG